MLDGDDLQKIRVEFGEAFTQVVMPQFDRMDERFDRMDERFDRMDERFDRMDKRFDQVDKRLERIENDIRDIRLEIVSLRRDLEVLSNRDKEDSDAFAREILNMKRRIDALEERVNRKEAASVAAS